MALSLPLFLLQIPETFKIGCWIFLSIRNNIENSDEEGEEWYIANTKLCWHNIILSSLPSSPSSWSLSSWDLLLVASFAEIFYSVMLVFGHLYLYLYSGICICICIQIRASVQNVSHLITFQFHLRLWIGQFLCFNSCQSTFDIQPSSFHW